jgi:serine/threonine protein kinase
MGIVYEAEQPSLNRRVALKVLPGAGWADDRPMQRFLREAKTTASLKHGNIVPVYAVGHEDDLHYYVMPLIVGAGLDRVILELRERKLASFEGPETFDDDLLGVARTLLERTSAEAPAPSKGGRTEPDDSPLSLIVTEPSGRLTDPPIRRGASKKSASRHWQGIAQIGRQVADALQHAHDAGVLHRDIKPANLLLDADGVVWVADFGLAKAMSHDDLSRTGDLVGTLRYMAPERFRGQCDSRSDQYSLGLTLYELMTLRPAYDLADRAELIRIIAEARPTRPRELNPSIPIDLETVVLKAIDPDPACRYATLQDLADDLGRFSDGQAVLARRVGIIERSTRWIRRNPALATLALLSLSLAIIAGYFFWHWYHPPERPPIKEAIAEPVRPNLGSMEDELPSGFNGEELPPEPPPHLRRFPPPGGPRGRGGFPPPPPGPGGFRPHDPLGLGPPGRGGPPPDGPPPDGPPQ